MVHVCCSIVVLNGLFKFILVLLQYVFLNFAVFQSLHLNDSLLPALARRNAAATILLQLHAQRLPASGRHIKGAILFSIDQKAVDIV